MPKPSPGRTPAAKPRRGTLSEFAPNVFVGGWKDAVAFDGARFCVLDEAPEDLPPATTHVAIYNETSDRADLRNLDRLAKAMAAAHRGGRPVLVFCGHGIYRSPLGAAWYLHRSEGVDLDEAYRRVIASRPKARHAREWVGNATELEHA